ncbi:alpha/beta fold hydrolase [Roseibium salinum]|uniref:Alpha/beta hydrolase n=1 Tax=Roseibium salinum TaxID=1604349 RepID=A0ABT3R8A2_9HYPH|nr:alpha/beta hydrolase [Roseibium sp. DSM 29163]MCX2725326.1 alpha/beta hydrolase [Roseibium sp. DSM 29163]
MKLIDHPDNPVPEGARAGFVETPDGVRIRYAHWPASGRERRGTVTLVQGRAEFIEKYFEVIEDLRRRGFAVVTFDWRGQGGSQRLTRNPKRGHISNFRKYRLDLRTVLKEISLANYPGPHFALAHSTGALVLLSDSQRLRTMLDRAVITSPLLGLPSGAWAPNLVASARRFLRKATFGLLGQPPLKAGARRTSALLENIGFPAARIFSLLGMGRLFIPGGNAEIFIPFETNRQTSDRIRFDRFNKVLKQAPELGVGAPTIGWLNAAARTMLALRRRDAGPNMKLPCLVLAAGNDRIVSTPETEDFVSRTKAAAYVEIPGAAHELMMERDIFRDQFWAAFDAFVPGAEAEQELERARI